MGGIAALLLGLVLLHQWLVGNWFARVLVFLGAALLLVMMSAPYGRPEQAPSLASELLRLAACVGTAWLLSSAPTYYWRARSRARARAAARWIAPGGPPPR